VKIVNGQYKPEGTFHHGVQGTGIFDEKGTLWGITKPRDMTYMHSLGGEAPFFQALGEKGRLLGTRCDNKGCEGRGTIYLPFRICCPDCLSKMKVIDLTDVAIKGARVHTYIVTHRSGAFNTLDKPIRFIDVEFPGVSTMLKGYMSGPGTPAFGLRVIPIFRTKNPTYTITDLSWVAEGTKAKDLPEGFTFAKPRK
ncbi:MAG: hypothetical protein WC889_10070, partial [Myxococcota bacterium]